MAQQPDPSMFDFGLPDPDAVQDQVNQGYQRAETTSGGSLGGTMSIQAGGTIQKGVDAIFGNPNVRSAQAMQTRMRSILSDVNDASPKNEDPIDHAMRTASAVMTGMADINPRASMAASQQIMQLAQAKQQQGLLGTEAALSKVKLGEEQQKATSDAYRNALVVMDPNADPMNPKASPSVTISMVDDNGNPRTGAEISAQVLAARKKLQDLGIQDPGMSTVANQDDHKLQLGAAKIAAATQRDIADNNRALQVQAMKDIATANKPPPFPAATQTAINTKATALSTLGTTTGQMVDLIHDDPGAFTKASSIASTFQNIGQQARSLFQGDLIANGDTGGGVASDQLLHDALGSKTVTPSMAAENPALKVGAQNPHYQDNPSARAFESQLTMVVARTMAPGQRLNLQEIEMAHGIVGNDVAPGTRMRNMGNYLQNQLETWKDMPDSTIGMRQNAGAMDIHARTAARLQTSIDKVNAEIKEKGYGPPIGQSTPADAPKGGPPPKDMTMPPAEAVQRYADKHGITGAAAYDALTKMGYK